MAILVFFPSSSRRGAAGGGGVVIAANIKPPRRFAPPLLVQGGEILQCRSYRAVFRCRGIAPAASILRIDSLVNSALGASPPITNIRIEGLFFGPLVTFLKRATRFIIVLRDMPRRGSVSLYSMIVSYLMLHNNSRRRRYESTALCLRATRVACRSARAARRAQGRGARACRRPEPRADDEFSRRGAQGSRRYQPYRGALGDQSHEESRPYRCAGAPRRARALGRYRAAPASRCKRHAAYRAPGHPQPRHLRRELRARRPCGGAAGLRARARGDLYRRRQEG